MPVAIDNVYIHYGSDTFIPDAPVSVCRGDKPAGLWASPVNAEWGWKDWCMSEDFKVSSLSRSFTFSLDAKCRILDIHHPSEFMGYVEKYDDFGLTCYRINHDALMRDYDAMEVHFSENFSEFHYHPIFCMWDVDSLVIWNLDHVNVIDQTSCMEDPLCQISK